MQSVASRIRLCNFLIDKLKFNRQAVCSTNRLNHLINRTKSSRSGDENGTEGANGADLSSLVVPIPVRISNNPDDINVGLEITGKQIRKEELLRILNEFFKRQPIKKLSESNGIDARLFNQCYNSFRMYLVEKKVLPAELHITLSDILLGHGHVDSLFPYFLKHSREVFPHLECIEELRKISDLTSPVNWYPEARALKRKIYFHSGPTNSGKTYNALKRFLNSASGVYCGPLKLLAVEVNTKANDAGTKCDLITGEERLYANENGTPSEHVACTVEMTSVTTPYEVAVIDEIQMLRDSTRGWAWTRALLGVAAKEIHLCGEEAAVDLVKDLLLPIGEEVEVCRYDRLTKLIVEDEALKSLDNVRPGDCIVCFNKNDIYSVSLNLEKKGHQVAVIYGGLPPGTKLAQTKKFNDPDDPCKLLVATDAIGMGLNLSIRRVIFYSLMKPNVNEKGEKEMDLISTSTALQIGGRAGRYKTQFDIGSVTTFKPEDLQILRDILAKPVDPIPAAGLHPTAEQIELFAYHLPHATLANLIDIFVSICQVDTSNYFMCNIEDFKYFAELIQHVPLPLRARYVFCCAPINRKMPLVCTMFLKYARQYSQNEPITMEWLCRQINWPFKAPAKIDELLFLEAAFDVLDLYLWLSYRFQDLFPDAHLVREMQKELDAIINIGVLRITKLIKSTSTSSKINRVTNREPAKSDVRLVRDTLEMNEKDKLAQNNGTLTNQLLASGLLTPKLMEKLKKEWEASRENKLYSKNVNNENDLVNSDNENDSMSDDDNEENKDSTSNARNEIINKSSKSNNSNEKRKKKKKKR